MTSSKIVLPALPKSHCGDSFTHFNMLLLADEAELTPLAILHIKKLSLREVKWMDQSHILDPTNVQIYPDTNIKAEGEK